MSSRQLAAADEVEWIDEPDFAAALPHGSVGVTALPAPGRADDDVEVATATKPLHGTASRSPVSGAGAGTGAGAGAGASDGDSERECDGGHEVSKCDDADDGGSCPPRRHARGDSGGAGGDEWLQPKPVYKSIKADFQLPVVRAMPPPRKPVVGGSPRAVSAPTRAHSDSKLQVDDADDFAVDDTARWVNDDDDDELDRMLLSAAPDPSGGMRALLQPSHSRFDRRSFSESVDPSSFPTAAYVAAGAADDADSDVELEDKDDASASVPPCPALPPSQAFFLRWSHYHVFATTKALYPALRTALAAHADVRFDRRQWKFVCEVSVADELATPQGSPTTSAPPAATAKSGGAGGPPPVAPTPRRPHAITRGTSLRHSRSSPDLLRSRFVVRAHLLDGASNHHVVEFASACRVPPRLFKAVFVASMEAVRAAEDVMQVVQLPVPRMIQPGSSVKDVVAAFMAASTPTTPTSVTSVEQLPSAPTHHPSLPAGGAHTTAPATPGSAAAGTPSPAARTASGRVALPG